MVSQSILLAIVLSVRLDRVLEMRRTQLAFKARRDLLTHRSGARGLDRTKAAMNLRCGRPAFVGAGPDNGLRGFEI